jgi:hypothetical protein
MKAWLMKILPAVIQFLRENTHPELLGAIFILIENTPKLLKPKFQEEYTSLKPNGKYVLLLL